MSNDILQDHHRSDPVDGKDCYRHNDNHDDNHDENDSLDDDDDAAVTTAPLRYTRPVFFRQTRKRGKIIKTVTERYVRDDLGCGCVFVAHEPEPDHNNNNNNDNDKEKQTNKMNSPSKKRRNDVDRVVGKPHVIANVEQLLSLLQPCQPPSLVVCDTNVLLHNLDVLEQATEKMVMPNLVIPQTALIECRKNRVVAYDRTVDLLRSITSDGGTGGTNHRQQRQRQQRCCILFPDVNHAATATVDHHASRSTLNDENDARIRNVARFLGQQLHGSHIRVILCTDDAASRTIAAACPFYQAYSVRAWVHEMEQHNPGVTLSDVVAQLGGATLAFSTQAQQQQQHYFVPHVEASRLSRGLQTGTYFRGVFRSSHRESAWITIRRGEERVAVRITGWADRNRAIDGDVVAVALHPLEQWITSPSSCEAKSKSTTTTTTTTTITRENENDAATIANETADPTLGDLENVAESVVRVEHGAAQTLCPTGKVVGIIRRNFGTHCGSVFSMSSSLEHHHHSEPQHGPTEREQLAAEYEREHADGSTTCVFFPVDKKMPPILIRTTQRDRLLGQRIIVSMDSWPSHSPYPLGHYVRTLGPTGSKDVETQVVLHQYDIPHEPFPASVLACLPPDDYRIDAENSPGRVDLRHLPVLSIDPPGCKDIDDALHCIELPNGNWQVGVHIADVTHYVKPGTAMDLEAANRSTSTYLVNKRLDMLPSLLTTDLCSLKGNVDRYAFSVLWEVTPEAEIINVDFKKTIIHSIAALTYQQAQSFIDQADDVDDVQASAVKRLAKLARKFRKRRIDAGALTLASPEVKFVLDSESLNPTDVQAYALLEANALVEEFMLLANVTVAKKILRNYPTLSVLRRHPAPNRAMFDNLISKAKCKGLEIDIEDSKRLADSLDAAIVDTDPYINKLLRILSTRCMSPAQYFCSGEFRPTEWHHYGLAAPVYTHFTSPIRRYADVCVHRLLAAAIGVAPLPNHLSSKSYLHDLCANMNRRHRAAQLAGRSSVQLHTLIFFSGDGAKEETAYVLDVETRESHDPSFTVMIPRYGIEGRVRLNVSANDTNLTRFPEQHKLSYSDGSSATAVSVQVFDKVTVRIWVREMEDHRELVLDLIRPQIGENATTSSAKRQASAEPITTNDVAPASRDGLPSTFPKKKRRRS